MTRDEDFAAASDAPTPTRPSLLRFSLVTLMSATAVFAVWMAYYLTLKETSRMQAALPGLRDVARELRIEDPQKFAAVRHQELTFDDYRWRVYLPPGDKYQLCVSSKNIDLSYSSNADRQKPAATMAAPLAPGEHELMLMYEKEGEEWTIRTSVDGEVILQETLPADWNPGRDWGGGCRIEASCQIPTDEPLDLFDAIFHQPLPYRPNTSNSEHSETGVRLWVEKLK